MEYHEAANIFPLDDDSLQSLADDIKASGLLCPVELLDGQIIDGRRRWAACLLACVKPDTCDVTVDDPLAYVLSLNLHRRHLTPSQLSMVAARARGMYNTAAKERQKQHGNTAPGKGKNTSGKLAGSDSRDAAGKAVGVSGTSVDYATKVLRKGTPELVKAVDDGRMAVSTAAVHASEPAEVQREILSKRPNRKYKSPGNKGKATADDAPTDKDAPRLGIQRAHEAISCLKEISVVDALRKRGFQIVSDWIRHNK